MSFADSFPPETHPCLLHLEVHPLTPVCWRAAVSFQLGMTLVRPDISDRDLADAYDAEFERKCLDFHIRLHRATDIPAGFADSYLADWLGPNPYALHHYAPTSYPTLTEFLGAIA